MPIDEVPHYQVICKDDLVDNLNKRVDNSSREELIDLINKFADKVDPKTLREVLTS